MYSGSRIRGGGRGNHGSRVSQLACITARAYHCSQIRGGGSGDHRPRVSQPACVKARVDRRSHIRGGRTGLSKLACVITRVHHCWHRRKGGPGNHSPRVPRVACIVARVNHCSQTRGGGEAINGRVHHSSRLPLLAACRRGHQAITAPVYRNSRASLLACTIARKKGGGPGNRSSRASYLA